VVFKNVYSSELTSTFKTTSPDLEAGCNINKEIEVYMIVNGFFFLHYLAVEGDDIPFDRVIPFN